MIKKKEFIFHYGLIKYEKLYYQGLYDPLEILGNNGYYYIDSDKPNDKSNSTYPYIQYSVTSSQFETWYNGLYDSASIYDNTLDTGCWPSKPFNETNSPNILNSCPDTKLLSKSMRTCWFSNGKIWR